MLVWLCTIKISSPLPSNSHHFIDQCIISKVWTCLNNPNILHKLKDTIDFMYEICDKRALLDAPIVPAVANISLMSLASIWRLAKMGATRAKIRAKAVSSKQIYCHIDAVHLNVSGKLIVKKLYHWRNSSLQNNLNATVELYFAQHKINFG